MVPNVSCQLAEGSGRSAMPAAASAVITSATECLQSIATGQEHQPVIEVITPERDIRYSASTL